MIPRLPSLFCLSFPKEIRVWTCRLIWVPHLRDNLTVAKVGSSYLAPLCLSFPKGIRFCSSWSVALLTTVALSAGTMQPAQTPPKRKLFLNREDGVTFSYPATWLLNADDDAATAKLRLADLAPPHAVIQLEGNFAGAPPYAGTDFEAGTFAYTTFNSPPDACLSTLNPIATGLDQPSTITWRGLPARRLEATFTVAGTDDLHTLIAAAQPTRCLLFETVLIRKKHRPRHRPALPRTLGHPSRSVCFHIQLGPARSP